MPLIWAALRALPLLWQIAVWAALFSVIAGTYGLWHHSVRQAGYDSAIADVAQQNAAAKALVKRATTKVDDCEAHGGTWDVTVGRCN